jgi:hypothetical protein
VAAAHTFSAFVDDDCTGQFLLASRAAECRAVTRNLILFSTLARMRRFFWTIDA